MTLNLHYCGGNHNQGPPNAAAVGERGSGSLVLTPLARIPCSWYWSGAAADVFEAWADVRRHFPVDDSWSAVSGWSMGGYGAYKLVAQFPDLFGRALTDIGCVSAETGWPGRPAPSISGPGAEIIHLVPSFRNVPLLSANGNADPLCTTSSQAQVLERFRELGYRYDWRWYAGGHGPMYPTGQEVAEYLGTDKVEPNPPHVTYVVNEAMNEPEWGLNSDHAYWLSGLTLRDPSAGDGMGTVDAFSRGFGVAKRQPAPVETTAGTSNGVPYTGELGTWREPAAAPVRDELALTLTNISSVTVDVARARLSCDTELDVTTEGPVAVHLAGCRRTLHAG